MHVKILSACKIYSPVEMPCEISIRRPRPLQQRPRDNQKAMNDKRALVVEFIATTCLCNALRNTSARIESVQNKLMTYSAHCHQFS